MSDGSDAPEAGARLEQPTPAEQALREKVQGLPTAPGVYLFHGETERVLYVGKAQSLRARVRSYFQQGGDGRFQMHFLVPRIRDVEVVVTGNVKEALLLENQLIKKHKPRFNVRLRDDKNYLALRLDPRETYPRFSETRRFLRDGAVYFGPYTSSASMRRTLGTLQRIFPLRTCSDGVFKSYARQGRPCLEHSLGRCAAPCCGKIDDAAYAAIVGGAVRFMKGQAQELVRDMREQMARAAAEESFEEAARLRDRIGSIERTVERQSMVSTQFVDRDVFALARDGGRLEIQVLHVRQGKLTGGRAHGFNKIELDDAEALDSFLTQYYGGDRDLPRELLLPFEVESAEVLDALWQERSGRALKLLVPQRGEGRRLVEMAQQNADLALGERNRREQNADASLDDLQQLLRLPTRPERIECYDTSHLQGTLHVGSRVSFVNGLPDKDGYRRYRLQEAAPGDDFGAMREILSRRLERIESEPVPDLIVIDGGKGQLGVVTALLEDREIEDVQVVSIAKERDEDAPSPRVKRHAGTKAERVFLQNVKDPIAPPPDAAGMLLLQRVRDESHRFAIRYHRELRRKVNLRSILDELPGIGPVKRRALLRHFGSLERLKQAGERELREVPRISAADAQRIVRFFADAPGGASEASGQD